MGRRLENFRRLARLAGADALGWLDSEESLIRGYLRAANSRLYDSDDRFEKVFDEVDKFINDYHGESLRDFELVRDYLGDMRSEFLKYRKGGYGAADAL